MAAARRGGRGTRRLCAAPARRGRPARGRTRLPARRRTFRVPARRCLVRAVAFLGPVGVHAGGRSVGGVATHTVRSATALAEAGWRVAVFADDVTGVPGGSAPTPWGERFGVMGAPAAALAPHVLAISAAALRASGDARRTALGMRLDRVASRAMLVRSAARTFVPDVLHVQQADFRPLYAAWAGLTHLPTVVTVHGLGALVTGEYPELASVIPENLRRARAITAPSHFLAAEVARIAPGAPEVRVVPNGVDRDRFRPRDRAECRVRLALDPDAPLVVYVGRVTEAKGALDLLAAYDRLLAEMPDARLAFVGPVETVQPFPVPLRDEAPADAGTFVVADADDRRVAHWLGAADLVAVPSRYEGFGLSALEAMASARAVVAADVGGLAEIVTDDSGVRVPAQDPEALAEALLALLRNRRRAAELGEAGAERARAYTWAATANGFTALYEELLA
ncbi:MAG: hypothetical protein C0418_03055 [Coriobacteriaceae bacterium]|nr:hypothetical protein [Coriobacteriaceae bacterium]